MEDGPENTKTRGRWLRKWEKRKQRYFGRQPGCGAVEIGEPRIMFNFK